jgi:hypothetical protein
MGLVYAGNSRVQVSRHCAHLVAQCLHRRLLRLQFGVRAVAILLRGDSLLG